MAPVPPLATVSLLTRLRVPSPAAWLKRFVDDAVVEKKLVVVALAKVVLPVNAFVPLNVLLSARSVELAADPSRIGQARP